MKKVVICLAEGFEEIEAVVPIDLMRRAGIEVTVAGIENTTITGSRGVKIKTDGELSEFSEKDFDCIMLPGGLPGATNLAASWEVNERIIHMFNEGKIVAAICAAPAAVLAKTGILQGRKATCYPGAESFSTDTTFEKKSLVIDGNLITAQGPGYASLFGFAVIEALVGAAKAKEVTKEALF